MCVQNPRNPCAQVVGLRRARYHITGHCGKWEAGKQKGGTDLIDTLEGHEKIRDAREASARRRSGCDVFVALFTKDGTEVSVLGEWIG